jgi:hypothetical protein
MQVTGPGSVVAWIGGICGRAENGGRECGGSAKKTAGGGKEDENPTGWRDYLGGKSLSLALIL